MWPRRKYIRKLIAAAPCIQDPNLSYNENNNKRIGSHFFLFIFHGNSITSSTVWLSNESNSNSISMFFAIFQLKHQMCVCVVLKDYKTQNQHCIWCWFFFVYLFSKKKIKFHQITTYSFSTFLKTTHIHSKKTVAFFPQNQSISMG